MDLMSESTQGDDKGDDLEKDKTGPRTCLGCMRCDGEATCFLEKDADIAWVYDSQRGSWCRECHTVWRHIAKPTMTLTMYEMHLSKNWRNHVVHLQSLLAYITLRHENQKRNVTKERSWNVAVYGILMPPLSPL